MPSLRYLLLVAVATLTACSSTLLAYKDTLEVAYFGLPPASFSTEQLLNNSQDIMYVTLTDGPRVSLAKVLATNDTATWGSADHAALVMVGNRLTRTTGFPTNLLQVGAPRMQLAAAISSDSVVGQQAPLQVVHQDARVAHLVWHSKVIAKTQTTLSYDGYNVQVIEIQEQLTSEQLDTELVQSYWFDAGSGKLLRTHQQLSPLMPAYDIVFISDLARSATHNKDR